MHAASSLHHIRKYVLRQLTMTKWARFRDLRPKNVDSNLYNYHLKELIKDGFVEHDKEKGYRLSPMGLRYVDHISLETFEPRWQPKIVTVFVTHDKVGRVLMWPKYKQPFIDKFSLPSGKMHYDDESVESALNRELSYFLSTRPSNIKHVGVMEYRAFIDDILVTHTMAHVFNGDVSQVPILSDRLHWIDLKSLKDTDMSPGTKQTIDAVKNHTTFFFEKHDINW